MAHQLMLMLIDLERTFVKAGQNERKAPVSWVVEGRAFIIQGDREELTKQWLPKFFPHGKFSSFTRKLYRWGFRQVCLPTAVTATRKADRALTFSHPYFQRERPALISFMQSVTAAGLRRQAERQQGTTGASRTLSSTSLAPAFPSGGGMPVVSSRSSSADNVSAALQQQQQRDSSLGAGAQHGMTMTQSHLSLINSLLERQAQAQQQQLQEGALQLLRLGMMTNIANQARPQGTSPHTPPARSAQSHALGGGAFPNLSQLSPNVVPFWNGNPQVAAAMAMAWITSLQNGGAGGPRSNATVGSTNVVPKSDTEGGDPKGDTKQPGGSGGDPSS